LVTNIGDTYSFLLIQRIICSSEPDPRTIKPRYALLIFINKALKTSIDKTRVIGSDVILRFFNILCSDYVIFSHLNVLHIFLYLLFVSQCTRSDSDKTSEVSAFSFRISRVIFNAGHGRHNLENYEPRIPNMAGPVSVVIVLFCCRRRFPLHCETPGHHRPRRLRRHR